MNLNSSAAKTEALRNLLETAEREIELIQARIKANDTIFTTLQTTLVNNIETAYQSLEFDWED
jgi:hypothetical protein